MAKEAETAVVRLERELQRLRDAGCARLDQVEILLAALQAFNMPVPDYEPKFRHMHPTTRFVIELKR
jgi:hypothetical protein